VVEQTKARSGWPARKTLWTLGVAPRSYYRWRRRKAWERPPDPSRTVSGPAYEATAAERQAVIDFARKHVAVRHRELAWKMVDEGVACLSPSTVYRILKAEHLLCTWRRREKRNRLPDEKAARPNERWATDLMYVQVCAVTYYWIGFLDEYSRYVVHWELLSSMDGLSISGAAKRAIGTLPHGPDGRPQTKPAIRSDNGSGYVSAEFRRVLAASGMKHTRIKPHCPEENGLMERANRTLREELDGEALTTPDQARDVLARVIRRYNEARLHSALGYLRPIDYYRGDPTALHEERRKKLAEARHCRRETNLALRQKTLAFPDPEARTDCDG
jgi:putative transposase